MMDRIGFRCRCSLGSVNGAGSVPDALLVAIGAVPGAGCAEDVNHFEPMVPKKHWGTFTVNVLACFALGWCWRCRKAALPAPASCC